MQFKHTPLEARKLWAEALRSGEFTQGKGRLCRVSPEGEQTHCCLGVAYRVFDRVETPVPTETVANSDGSGTRCVAFGDEHNTSALGTDLDEWLGFDGWRDADGVPITQTRLYVANDSSGQTFAEIADLIDP